MGTTTAVDKTLSELQRLRAMRDHLSRVQHDLVDAANSNLTKASRMARDAQELQTVAIALQSWADTIGDALRSGMGEAP